MLISQLFPRFGQGAIAVMCKNIIKTMIYFKNSEIASLAASQPPLFHFIYERALDRLNQACLRCLSSGAG
jgi:malic enzyme